MVAVTLLPLNSMQINYPPMMKQKPYPIKRKVEDKGHALQQQKGRASFLLTRVLFFKRRQLSANSET